VLLDSARTAVSGLKHLWLDAGYEGRAKRWVEEVLNLSVELVRRPAKPAPEEVARSWAQEWAKEVLAKKPMFELGCLGEGVDEFFSGIYLAPYHVVLLVVLVGEHRVASRCRSHGIILVSPCGCKGWR
jgi:hypothetical protein